MIQKNSIFPSSNNELTFRNIKSKGAVIVKKEYIRKSAVKLPSQ